MSTRRRTCGHSEPARLIAGLWSCVCLGLGSSVVLSPSAAVAQDRQGFLTRLEVGADASYTLRTVAGVGVHHVSLFVGARGETS